MALSQPVLGGTFPLPNFLPVIKAMAECPVCGAELSLSDDLVKGELLECDDCGTELEVTNLEPVTVQEAPEAEEDWGQ
jgi:alpha-aminoadipate carrier protein LysW